MADRPPVLHLRIPRHITEAVDAYAKRRGVKRTAAICVLISEQLEAQGFLPAPTATA